MIWKYLEQNILCPKDLNWVQHCVSRIGLFTEGVKIKITHLHLAVPPPFTVAKGTQGFKEDLMETCITN